MLDVENKTENAVAYGRRAYRPQVNCAYDRLAALTDARKSKEPVT